MNKNKKILLISNMYPSKKYPHYGVFIKNIENELKKNGFIIDKCVLKKVDSNILKLFNYLLFYLKIVGKGLFTNYNCIYGHYITHIYFPLLIIKKIRHNIIIILHVHGNDIIPENKKDEKFIPLAKKALKLSEQIIAPSLYFKNILIKEFHINESKIFVSPSGGIDSNTFFKKNRKYACNTLNLDANKKYIGYVSRIEINKGWDIFLDACSRIIKKYDIEIIVVGSGDEETLYNKKVEDLNLKPRIHKYPLLSQEEIANVFSILNIFCFPTKRKSESLGLVGLEAMACKTVVVGSDSYGPSSYIINKINGFTFDINSVESLCETIEKVFSMSEDELNKIKQKAYETSQLYNSEKVNTKLSEFFKKVI